MQNPPLLSILILAYEDLGAWKIRILDATNHPARKWKRRASAMSMALMG